MYEGVQVKCKCGRVVTIGELEKHESQCQAQDWQQKVKELTSENEALRKENRTLKEELAALKAPLSKPAVAEVSRKRGEPPAKPKSAAEERKALWTCIPHSLIVELPSSLSIVLNSLLSDNNPHSSLPAQSAQSKRYHIPVCRTER